MISVTRTVGAGVKVSSLKATEDQVFTRVFACVLLATVTEDLFAGAQF